MWAIASNMPLPDGDVPIRSRATIIRILAPLDTHLRSFKSRRPVEIRNRQYLTCINNMGAAYHFCVMRFAIPRRACRPARFAHTTCSWSAATYLRFNQRENENDCLTGGFDLEIFTRIVSIPEISTPRSRLNAFFRQMMKLLFRYPWRRTRGNSFYGVYTPMADQTRENGCTCFESDIYLTFMILHIQYLRRVLQYMSQQINYICLMLRLWRSIVIWIAAT